MQRSRALSGDGVADLLPPDDAHTPAASPPLTWCGSRKPESVEMLDICSSHNHPCTADFPIEAER
jgi:hypothetical protein